MDRQTPQQITPVPWAALRLGRALPHGELSGTAAFRGDHGKLGERRRPKAGRPSSPSRASGMEGAKSRPGCPTVCRGGRSPSRRTKERPLGTAALRGRTGEDLGSRVIGVPGPLASPSCGGTGSRARDQSRRPGLLALEADGGCQLGVLLADRGAGARGGRAELRPESSPLPCRVVHPERGATCRQTASQLSAARRGTRWTLARRWAHPDVQHSEQ